MPPPTTTHHHLRPSTTTHDHPRPPTTIHHHPPPAKIYPPLPTISQKRTAIPQKPKYILLDIALTVIFSSKCNIPFRDGDFAW